MEKEYFRIGVITEPHGVQGEVKLFPTTDDVLHLKKVKEVYLKNGEAYNLLHLKGLKQQHDRIILRFSEYTDRNAAEGLRKKELYVERADAVPLEENEYYISDLIGLAVYESDVQIGRISDVIETGANDVYQIARTDGTELLLPAIRQCVLNVDIAGGRMDVSVMEGL
ncbi:MAG: 16S rRNA processing protein RimM [Lachnospiraceae bacterium]|nr:16S rRNA processing protein RimM [Lachnospiraceae bacterium]